MMLKSRKSMLLLYIVRIQQEKDAYQNDNEYIPFDGLSEG